MNPPVTAKRVEHILRGKKGDTGLVQKVNVRIEKVAETREMKNGVRRTVQKTIVSLDDASALVPVNAIVRIREHSEPIAEPMLEPIPEPT